MFIEFVTRALNDNKNAFWQVFTWRHSIQSESIWILWSDLRVISPTKSAAILMPSYMYNDTIRDIVTYLRGLVTWARPSSPRFGLDKG